MMKVKFLIRQVQRMRNILVILVLFVCTSICLGLGEHPNQEIIIKSAINTGEGIIAGNGDPNSESANYGKLPEDDWHKPVGNRLIIRNSEAEVGRAFGAYMDAHTFGTKKFISMTDNEVMVYDWDFGYNGVGDIAGAFAYDIDYDMNVSSNTVIITGGTGIANVYGGCIKKGTVSSNTVTISNSVTIGRDVLGAWIVDGLASSNEVTITGGRVGENVLGGYIAKNGTATGNTVTISGGKIVGNVFGGYVGGNGEATYNTTNITAATEFSPESILCGGICANATTNDAVQATH